ncbi:glycosyl hydrolase [Edaphobacter dinghuensis]|uniref:Alpha-L-rhamnosidase-like protein n=1 Tax=Edaphobacter dinghuensis TaxID=1560005 RepID=A0A917HNS8_9BACT|nr:glycosyl hydrolase [Edaphobacter dinghuensis]GGG84537.1 hypothetical protein GCM10011585_30410 [Edaphobacter dinghuensis]
MTGSRHTVTRQLALALALAFTSLPLAAAYSQPAKSTRSVPERLGSVSSDSLVRGFQSPPAPARLRCYWWWLNGHTTKATITRDLTEMKKKGYGGVLLVDANGANQGGNDNVPPGPEFGSPAWKELYVHALRVANQLGLEVTLNITSGWNLGGPQVKPEDASKLLTWSRTTVRPDAAGIIRLDQPKEKNGFYRQISVLAYPLHKGAALASAPGDSRKPMTRLALKSAAAEDGFSMPDLSSLLTETAPTSSDQDADFAKVEVQDISDKVDADGTLHWAPPSDSPYSWEVLRIGYTDSDARVSTSSGAWQGLAIDYLDTTALDHYWDRAVLPLLTGAAAPYVGKSLKYVATDSWELGGTNWTGRFREEFRRRRGYDPVPYLPIVAGRIIGSRELSNRFLADLRRTVADLVNTHYDHMAERAKQFGLGIQCESGGPHSAPIDALETFQRSAVPQTEYWAMSPQHRSADTDRYFVKEAASAAHIYGRPFSAAEGMTSIGNQWNESIGMNLKPSFDQALTEGLNRLVWHAFTSSPPELGLPGQEYFAGTHLNPNVTWWRDAGPFFLYLNRSQFLMQQGNPVNDVLYYYGDNVPNFVRLKRDDPARVLPGYDYDVTSTDALLGRMLTGSGDLHTPEGIHYRALVLPHSRILPLAVLELAQHYVEGGGTLIGLRPLHSQGIVSESDAARFSAIADTLWTPCEQSAEHRSKTGKGQLFCTDNAHAAMQQLGVLPDFDAATPEQTASLDYVHRATAGADIYFIRNRQPKPLQATVTLRVGRKQPELFDAVTGETHPSLLFASTTDGRTAIPLSLRAYGSIFIVFRHSARDSIIRIQHNGTTVYDAAHASETALPFHLAAQEDGGGELLTTADPGSYEIAFADGKTKRLATDAAAAIAVRGPWTLSFPPDWGAPPQVKVDRLQSWTEFKDPGIRYFSGTATYRTTLHLSAAQLAATHTTWLNLGEVHEVASIRINGKPAGILWKQPFAIRVDTLLHAGDNVIEVDVTNLWPNRLIGDAQSSTGKHYTWTNIRKYTSDSPLLPSGLIGPVTLEPVYRLSLR